MRDRFRPWLGVLGNLAALAVVGALYLHARPLADGPTERGVLLTVALLYVAAMTGRRVARAWPRRTAGPPR